MAVPANGVYAVWVTCEGVRHRAVVNIGVRPTFGVSARTIEAHLLEFDGDLYGRTLSLAFVEHIRPERRFDTVEALVTQIGVDRDAAAHILAG
jgi:riboflavin kinase/FMN adenylyltransferase